MKRLLFATIILSIISISCQKNPCSDSVKAVFKDATGIGGCGMIIELGNGEYLEPRNLDDFTITPEDGKKIWLSYHIDPNGVSICMMGDPVNIDCIAER